MKEPMLQDAIRDFQIQLWVQSGVLTAVVIVLGFLIKSIWEDAKRFMQVTTEKLGRHDTDIAVLQHGHEVGAAIDQAADKISDAIDRKNEKLERLRR